MNIRNTFNTNFFASFALVLLVVFQSCKKNEAPEAAPAAAENDHIAALQQGLASSFDLSAGKVEYNKNEKQFVVDGDGIVSLEDAAARFASKGTAGAANEAAQRRYVYVVASSKVNTIKLFADATVPASWVAMLDSAIANWNSTGSKVYIQRITTATGANTTVNAVYNNTTNVIATAAYPDWAGNAGRKVTINTYHNGIATALKVFAITHELGHTLGLCHTNDTAATLIAGTPSSDLSSVMHSVCMSWTGFSSNDITAIKTLYPR